MGVRRSPRKHRSGKCCPPQKRGSLQTVLNGGGKLRTRASCDEGVKTARNPRGKLAIIPLDVVYEILGNLAPKDLLNIARTCKQFHATLFRKASKFVWKEALEATGVPQCPSDLNEIQYAAFIFGDICNYCFERFKKASLKFIWASRTKVCWHCAHGEQFFRHTPHGMFYSDRSIYFSPVVQYQPHGRYCVPKEDYDLLRQEYERITSAKERDSWFHSKEEEYMKLMEIRNPIEVWMEQQLQKRREDLFQARKTWWDSIVERIRKYGEENEDYIIPCDGDVFHLQDASLEREIEGMEEHWDFSFYSAIGRAGTRKITDRAWNKIKRRAIRCLQRSRSKRVADMLPDRFYELEMALDDSIDEGSYDSDSIPGCADIAIQPEIFAMLEADPDISVCSDKFRSILDESFPLFVERWRSQVESSLLMVMQKDYPSARMEDLHAPSTLFQCSSCDEVIRLGAAFQHPCTTEPRYIDRLSALTSTHRDQAPWSSDSFRLIC